MSRILTYGRPKK